MAIYNEPLNISDVVKMESEYGYSRETVTIVSGAGVVTIGTMLGIITASGKYSKATQAGVDGTAVPAGILLGTVDATSADVKAVVLKRGPADINANKIVFDSSFTTQTQKDAALNLLKASNGITFHRGA
jgi:hypothetical protein